MMATCDADRFVTLFMYTTDRELFTAEAAGKLLGGDDDEVLAALEASSGAWVCVGRSRLHSATIVGIEFGLAGDGRPLLMSVGRPLGRVRFREFEYHQRPDGARDSNCVGA